MERTGIDLIPAAPRDELMKLLDTASSKNIIYVHAPAGYGKSFSIRMWMAERGGGAWLNVSQLAGRKPSQFYEKLITALVALQPGNKALMEILSHKSFTAAPYEYSENAINSFHTHAVNNVGQQYIIAIDDFHLIENPNIIKRIPGLIISLSGIAKLCIISRAEPPDNFSEFLLKDIMTIVDIKHLKFTKPEVKEFFASCGQSLNEKQIISIMAATDGWAIGLNAFLLSGKKQRGPKQLSRYLEAFIKEQIWEKWDIGRRDFILRVSIEDEITPDFCNAITDRRDGADMLEALVKENAFISAEGESTYRFHHLFQDFLTKTLDAESEKKKNDIYTKAGDWFFKRKNYYKAVEYYIKSKNKNGITKSLKLMYNHNSPYAAIEDTVDIIHQSVDGAILDEYPFLLETLAWAAFVEGQGTDMEAYLDRYFKQLPKIIILHPASAQTALLLRSMDYRKNLADVTRSIKKLPLRLFGQSNTPSFTQNMPFYHRSSRDFSEYAHDTEKNIELLEKTIGVLIGDERDTHIGLICAGLDYEKGNINNAYEQALSISAKVKDSFAPETLFCAYMLLAAILNAQGYHSDMQKILNSVEDMIGRHKAYYLNANLRAFICRVKLENGDAKAAQEWLKDSAEPQHSPLSFYKLYAHFTTARSYIVTGEYNMAILFTKKLQALCEQYRRPLDIIETNILLAIAYWKKARGRQNDALHPLQKAIVSARQYGFTQVFANEGAEISNILHRLHKQAVQKDYNGELLPEEIKTLYISALAQAKHMRGLTGGRAPANIKFTTQQKIIMRHLNDGQTHNSIADKMNLKPSTIKTHMGLIYKKLDVVNGMDAIIKIRELGVLDDI